MALRAQSLPPPLPPPFGVSLLVFSSQRQSNRIPLGKDTNHSRLNKGNSEGAVSTRVHLSWLISYCSFMWFDQRILFVEKDRKAKEEEKNKKKYLDDDIWSNPQRSPFLILLFLKVTLDFFLRTLDQRDFQSNLAVFVCLFVCCTVFPNLDVDISRFFWHVALFSVSERKR